MRYLSILVLSLFAVTSVACNDDPQTCTCEFEHENHDHGDAGDNAGDDDAGNNTGNDDVGDDNTGNDDVIDENNDDNNDEDPPSSEFVTIDPDQPRFLLDGEPFYFAGTNLYWLTQWQSYGHESVDDAFEACEEVGIRVIRTWGFADGLAEDDPATMQISPGEYNETAFEALDYIIAEAGERDIKVILALTNYWNDYGGMEQYSEWAGGEGYEFFYTDEAPRDLFKDYIEYLLTRENTITGVEYRDDPTIMSWELANEANAYFDNGAEEGTLNDWYADMADYVRSIDSNHLISTGEEGFDIPANRDQYSDDYTNDWVTSGESGTSFIDNTALDGIDFGGAHLYPGPWGFSDAAADGNAWIVDHVEIAHSMDKPFILGEFGNSDRSVYEDWLETAEENDVAGTLLWELVPASRGGGITDIHVVYPDDTELVDVFTDHAATMNAR